MEKIVEDLVSLEEITVSEEVGFVDDQDKEWIDNRSKQEGNLTTNSSSLTNKNWRTCTS